MHMYRSNTLTGAAGNDGSNSSVSPRPLHDKQPASKQVSTLLYSMGEEEEVVLCYWYHRC